MGNRNSLLHQRTPAKTVAVTLIDSLVDYTIKISSNSRRFPKAMRYTVTDRLIKEGLKASGYARSASKVKRRDKDTYKSVIKQLRKCMDHLTRFESLMVQTKRFCDPKNFEFWSESFVKAYDAITAWHAYEQKAWRERKKRKRYGSMKTDEDGFIVFEESRPLKKWDTDRKYIRYH